MNYPIANVWKTLAAQNVTTTAAQKVGADDIRAAGEPHRNLRWIIYEAEGTVYYGGPEVTVAGGTHPGGTLAAGVPLMLEASVGLGLHFIAASSIGIRVQLGFEG